MKNYLFKLFSMAMFVMMSIGFVACGSDDSDPDKVSVSQPMVTLSETGGNMSISILSNTKWTVSGVPSWLMVSPTSGSGNGTISISATTNTEKNARTCTLTILAGSASSTIMVTQSGPTIDEDPVGSYTGTLKPMGYSDNPAPCYITITKLSTNTYRLTSLICETFGINITGGYNLTGTTTSDGRITLKSETTYSIEGSYYQKSLTLSFAMGSDTFFFTGVKN